MIIDKMRVLPGNPRGVELAKAYLHAIETDDVRGLRRLMEPNVTLSHANFSPVQGRDEALSLIQGYRQIVDRVEFDVRTIFGSERLIAIEKINLAAVAGKPRARVSTVTVLEFTEDGEIFAIRIYADIADLFRGLDSQHGVVAGR